MNQTRKHRSKSKATIVVALSAAYDRDHLLARGLGAEHLRELLVAIARPVLRNGASLAYGGNWVQSTFDRPNFTYELLGMISAEQEDNSLGGPDTNLQIGSLYNHIAWPHYLNVTTSTEAEWVNVCRILRISQTFAGLLPDEIVSDVPAEMETDRAIFNSAVVMSAMRSAIVSGMKIEWPGIPPTYIPPASAHVLLGGKTRGYSGFVPGLFEEALYAIENGHPTYILGGFGGAAHILSDLLLNGSSVEEVTVDWNRTHGGERVARLLGLEGKFRLPDGRKNTSMLLHDLQLKVKSTAANLNMVLQTGLDENETRELLVTRSIARAVQLVRKGLEAKIGLQSLPA